jgi:hypothetical protein
MKYVLLICYIVFFTWLGEELSDGLYQVAFIGGIVRGISANQMYKDLQGKAGALNPIRPEYQIPQEVQDYLANAMNMAQGDMAGYGRMMNTAQGTTANTLSQARNFADSGTSLLQSLTMADASGRRQMGDIDMKNQQFKQGAMNNLQSALLNMGQFQDKAFDFNQVQPYLQEEADKRAFEQAAMEQRAARNDAWASFADGIVNTAVAVGTAPMGAGGGSLFGKVFSGAKKAGQTTSETPIGLRANPKSFGMNRFKFGQ